MVKYRRKAVKPIKRPIIITAIISLITGVLLGAGGLYYTKFTVPMQKAKALARQQQSELESMVREGDVEEITADTIQINTDDGIMKFKANEYTTVQVGMSMKNAEGRKTDLTQFYKQGDSVSLLVKEDQILAIYRELRPDEGATS